MNLHQRECCVDMSATIPVLGRQLYSLTINGEKHTHGVSSAVSDMLGDMIDVLYEMYLESNDCSHASRVRYLHDDPDSIVITGVTGSFSWDNEGETIDWTLSRRLYTDDNLLDIQADYNYGEKIYQYRVQFFDMCYAVAKAATAVISETGIPGYHYLSERDEIDIHHLLYIKYLGIFRRPFPFSDVLPDAGQVNSPRDKNSLFSDEIELLRFEL